MISLAYAPNYWVSLLTFDIQPTCERLSETNSSCDHTYVCVSTSLCLVLSWNPGMFGVLLATIWSLHLESGLDTSYHVSLWYDVLSMPRITSNIICTK